jgi:hypothetical protein
VPVAVQRRQQRLADPRRTSLELADRRVPAVAGQSREQIAAPYAQERFVRIGRGVDLRIHRGPVEIEPAVIRLLQLKSLATDCSPVASTNWTYNVPAAEGRTKLY